LKDSSKCDKCGKEENTKGIEENKKYEAKKVDRLNGSIEMR